MRRSRPPMMPLELSQASARRGAPTLCHPSLTRSALQGGPLRVRARALAACLEMSERSARRSLRPRAADTDLRSSESANPACVCQRPASDSLRLLDREGDGIGSSPPPRHAMRRDTRAGSLIVSPSTVGGSSRIPRSFMRAKATTRPASFARSSRWRSDDHTPPSSTNSSR